MTQLDGLTFEELRTMGPHHNADTPCDCPDCIFCKRVAGDTFALLPDKADTRAILDSAFHHCVQKDVRPLLTIGLRADGVTSTHFANAALQLEHCTAGFIAIRRSLHRTAHPHTLAVIIGHHVRQLLGDLADLTEQTCPGVAGQNAASAVRDLRGNLRPLMDALHQNAAKTWAEHRRL